MLKIKFVIMLFLLCFLFSLVVFSQNEIMSLHDLERIEKAILYIPTKGIAKHKIKPCIHSYIIRHEKERKRLVKAIHISSTKYNILPLLMVVTAFREGNFRHSTKGKLGERTTFQIMNKENILKAIRKVEPKCELKTIEGSALCCAALLRINLDLCGSLGGAVVKYVSGRTCKADTNRLKWIKRDRIGIFKHLDKVL